MPVATLVALSTAALVLDYVDGSRRPAHRDGVGAGCAVRRRGRCLPDPRPLRVRRPDGRRMGAADRRRALRVPRRRVAARVDARDRCRRANGARWSRRRRAITLTIAAAGVLPAALTRRRRSPSRSPCSPSRSAATSGGCGATGTHPPAEASPRREHGRVRVGISAVLTVLAFMLVWAALVAPHEPSRLTLGAFLRLPLEGVVLVALALVLPGNTRRILAWVVGPVIGLLILVKILDFGFFTAFDRPFDPGDDWSYTHIGIETLRQSIGRTSANLALVGVALLVVAAVVLPDPGAASPDPGRGRPPPGVAPGGRRARRRLGALLGARRAARVRRAHRLHQRRRPGRLTRCARCRPTSSERARFAGEIRHDRYRHTPGRPAADRPARQGRPARVRRELREGGGRRARRSRRGSTTSSTRGRSSSRPPASRPAAAGSRRRPSAASAGWRTPRCSRGLGRQASGGTTSSSAAIG